MKASLVVAELPEALILGLVDELLEAFGASGSLHLLWPLLPLERYVLGFLKVLGGHHSRVIGFWLLEGLMQAIDGVGGLAARPRSRAGTIFELRTEGLRTNCCGALGLNWDSWRWFMGGCRAFGHSENRIWGVWYLEDFCCWLLFGSTLFMPWT